MNKATIIWAVPHEIGIAEKVGAEKVGAEIGDDSEQGANDSQISSV